MINYNQLIISTFGLVVESVPTKHGSRVRFPEGAILFLLITELFSKESIKEITVILLIDSNLSSEQQIR